MGYIEFKLQVRCVKLHVANLFNNHLFHLVAVLLSLVPALLLWLVDARQALLHVTQRLDGLLLTLLTYLLGLEVTILLLNWEGEDVGELLAVPVNIGLAHLDLDLSRNIVTILFRGPRAHNLLLSVSVVLCSLLPFAVELDCVGAGNIVNSFFLHVAIGCLHVAALVIILGGGVNVVSGIAHPVLPSEAPLHLVRLLERLVVDG